MATQHSRPWGLYLTTFAAALLAAASAVFWVLGTLGASAQGRAGAPLVASLAAPDTKNLARALGGGLALQSKPAETTSTQYQLLGVVAGSVGKGYALLVVGSAPPKAYTVGSAVGEGQVLQSVSARGAKIGNALQGDVTIELSLPKPPGM